MNPTTWVYLSSLLIIGTYFKFRRFWSVRNLDLALLLGLSPGLLLVAHDLEAWGFAWLFAVGACILLRLLLDPLMIRRPLLEPNLSAEGLFFTGIALLVFLTANVITGKLTESDLEGARRLDQILARRELPPEESGTSWHGPGYPLFYLFASFSNKALIADDDTQPEHYQRAMIRATTTRTTAILGHLAVVAGIVLIGYRHFDNFQMGVAAASLYLLLPYTAQMTARVDHVIPAALLVWAMASYRRPAVAGILMGLAIGVIWYPLFLLPLWGSFYWHRGLYRFAGAVAGALLAVIASLALTSSTLSSFFAQLMQMLGGTILSMEGASGFWLYHEPAFRIPILAAFVVMSIGLALWPAHKNLGTLLSCSAAVMVGVQFWHAQEGGLFMGWYLPLLLLTVFRPNLEDRVAEMAVIDGRFPWRRLAAAA